MYCGKLSGANFSMAKSFHLGGQAESPRLGSGRGGCRLWGCPADFQVYHATLRAWPAPRLNQQKGLATIPPDHSLVTRRMEVPNGLTNAPA
jgi:hypothetical protein